MLFGVIDWYHNINGYGVIIAANRENYFLHVNNCLHATVPVQKGTSMVFREGYDNKKNRNIAIDCRPIQKKDDWKIIIQYCEKYGAFSNRINQIAAEQLFRVLNINDVENEIAEYFENYLNKKFYIQYCEYIEGRLHRVYPNKQASFIFKNIISRFIGNFNEKILFLVWKNKKFRYILYDDNIDYEIPKDVLYKFKKEIGINEIKRILCYSYGKSFIKEITRLKLNSLNERLSDNRIKELFLFIEFVDNENKEKFREKLELFYFKKIKKIFKNKIDKLPKIEKQSQLDRYVKLKDKIPPELGHVKQLELDTIINKAIVRKSYAIFKVELFIKGFIDIKQLNFKLIINLFRKVSTSNEKKVDILAKLPMNLQLEILIENSKRKGYDNSYIILIHLLLNKKFYSFFDPLPSRIIEEVCDVKNQNKLLYSFNEYVTANATNDEKLNLFLKGFLKEPPKKKALESVGNLDRLDCSKLINHYKDDCNFAYSLLSKIIYSSDNNDFQWICELAHEVLNYDLFRRFNSEIKPKLKPKQYFDLWIRDKVIIEPTGDIKDYILDHYSINGFYHITHKYNIENIFKYGLLSHNEASDKLTQTNIANSKVNFRRTKPDPIYQRSIHNYVPLYFNPKNPMLFVRKDIQNDLIILKIKRDIINQPNTIFTDGNAASYSSSFFNSIEDLKKLNWKCINGLYWNDFDDGKRIRCAEVLSYSKIALSDISIIFTKTNTTKRYVQEKMKKNASITIKVTDYFYF